MRRVRQTVVRSTPALAGHQAGVTRFLPTPYQALDLPHPDPKPLGRFCLRQAAGLRQT
jgi:hypothetical protein